jgi:hypothetical protein
MVLAQSFLNPEPPMPLSVTELHPVVHELFHHTADQLARESGFCQRARKLTGPVFAQSLVFAFLQNPDATLDDFADTAERLLHDSVTGQAFDKRFTPQAAHFLQHCFLEAFNQSFNSVRPTLLPVLRRFAGVFLRDATLVGLPAQLAPWLPGRGGRQTPHGQAAAVKLVFEAEITTGELTEVCLLAGLDNERTAEVAHKPLPAGALLLEDLGFFSGPRLQAYMEQGVYFVSRVPCWTAFFDDQGRRLDVVKLLRHTSGWHWDQSVRILHGQQLTVRLLAERLPEAEAEQRRQRVLQEAQARGRTVSQKKLELCAWNILVTNAPEAVLSLEEALTVRRLRWQIELVFRLFKSEGKMDDSRSRCPWRVLCELYAKLLGQLVQHWTLLAAGYQMLKHSARRAARWVRKQALRLLAGLSSVAVLAGVVQRLAWVLPRRCRVTRRKAEPSALDRLFLLDHEFAQLHEVSGP